MKLNYIYLFQADHKWVDDSIKSIIFQMEKTGSKKQFIYPIPYEDFLEYRHKQNQAVISSYSIEELSKLRKLKKILQSTEEKISNRIKLFKKVSADLQKKKSKENRKQQFKAYIKEYPILTDFNDCPRSDMTLAAIANSANKKTCPKKIEVESEDVSHHDHHRKISAIIEEKLVNAREIKMERERNKVLMDQRKAKEMRQKIQSANIIRRARTKAKQIKAQWQQDRLLEARRIKQQKFKEQIEEYDELQHNLTQLQKQERDALIMWKMSLEQ